MKQYPQISRIHRVLGQIRGVERMIEDKRPCEEIIQQLMAARSSLEQICVIIVKDEAKNCLTGGKKKINRLEKLINDLYKIN